MNEYHDHIFEKKVIIFGDNIIQDSEVILNVLMTSVGALGNILNINVIISHYYFQHVCEQFILMNIEQNSHV